MLTKAQTLKLALLTDGLHVSSAALAALQQGDPLKPITLADYASTSGIGLCLEPDIWVNAPIQDHNPNFVTATPHTLEFDGHSFFVRSAQLEVAAYPVPVPIYYDHLSRAGEVFSSYAITHTDRVRISPIQGCSLACQFCDLPFRRRYHKHSPESLQQAVAAALQDPLLPARHVLISGGTPYAIDYDYERDVYQRICSAFPGTPIDVMMMPTGQLLDPMTLKGIGVNELSINLELFNEDAGRRLMPGKWKVGRDGYLHFIGSAVEVFGWGRVRSLLMVGLEPLTDTLLGVEALCQRGCTPVLSPFRPDPATPLRALLPPTVELLATAFEASSEIAARFGLHLGPSCVPCQHNTLTFPDGSAYYVN